MAETRVVGGTLFSVAASVYGDATLWAVLADANGISDPWLDGLVSVTIPDLVTPTLLLGRISITNG